jgi:hypothetical protein
MGLESLRQASLFTLIGVLISTAPMVMGVLFAIRPSDRLLALMRPVSLAGIFSAASSLLLGIANAVRSLADVPSTSTPLAFAGVVLSEAMIPPFIGFAFLTVAWLCVALGMRTDTFQASQR